MLSATLFGLLLVTADDRPENVAFQLALLVALPTAYQYLKHQSRGPAVRAQTLGLSCDGVHRIRRLRLVAERPASYVVFDGSSARQVSPEAPSTTSSLSSTSTCMARSRPPSRCFPT